jgi:hypothetical protein
VGEGQEAIVSLDAFPFTRTAPRLVTLPQSPATSSSSRATTPRRGSFIRRASASRKTR